MFKFTRQLKKIIIGSFAFLFFTGFAFSISLNQLRIVSDDGTFLGNFENEYSLKSVYNKYSDYGSPYSINSIMNKYGNYGSDYSDKSPFNKYGTSAPWLVDRYGNNYGRLSVNRYASGVTQDSYRIACQLKALRDSF